MPSPAPLASVALASQLILVTTPSWDAHTGTAQRYQRRDPRSPWRRIGAAIQVVVGRGGLGWRTDAGAQPPLRLGGGPQKHEGDGRSPAGVLPLLQAWGYGAAPLPGVRLPYHAASPRDRCVDDVDAAEYGQLVAEPAGGAPWRSAEEMRRQDDLYKHLIVVGYNTERPVRGAGSCIFIHLYRDTTTPTAGCTAMAEPDLVGLLRWLDPARHPVLVQVPVPVLPLARRAWGVP